MLLSLPNLALYILIFPSSGFTRLLEYSIRHWFEYSSHKLLDCDSRNLNDVTVLMCAVLVCWQL